MRFFSRACAVRDVWEGMFFLRGRNEFTVHGHRWAYGETLFRCLFILGGRVENTNHDCGGQGGQRKARKVRPDTRKRRDENQGKKKGRYVDKAADGRGYLYRGGYAWGVSVFTCAYVCVLFSLL
ncbi:hypothetical protein LZ32DRAFT_415694 [Colletotrichum eremochloae]|nr:hypothetical protein LZ32DRAFT_415694 [Colletotrichum eremochloae]